MDLHWAEQRSLPSACTLFAFARASPLVDTACTLFAFVRASPLVDTASTLALRGCC